MSFGHHTPEAFLSRSDSRNPATTCKGLTAAGRPCRRALAATATNSTPSPSNRNGNGVVAVLDEGDAAAFFCWQHKDQAQTLVTRLNSRTRVLPLKQKSSIDTLIERIGVLELDDEVGERNKQSVSQEPGHFRDERPRYDNGGLRKRGNLPQEWRRIQGPLMSVPEDVRESEGYRLSHVASRPPRVNHSERVSRPIVKASWSCCVIRADDEDLPPPRRAYHSQSDRPARQRRDDTFRPTSQQMAPANGSKYYKNPPATTPPRRRQESNIRSPQNNSTPITYPQLDRLPDSPISTPRRRPLQAQSSGSPPNSQTTTLLSLIPDHLSPNTTSALLSELSKPISSADEEGYIYIFWLTPDTDTSKPDDETASSLLDADDILSTPTRSQRPPSAMPTSADSRARRRSSLDRRQATHALTAQALQRFASINRGSNEPKKILLKIGRASNVHRRLSQWSRQCGQNITLIRYYPYTHSQQSSSSLSPPQNSKMKQQPVPHVHRVERLIHLELADQRVADKGPCAQCGREHKEWFEVEATRAGVRAVDEVVRRWVGWAQRLELEEAKSPSIDRHRE